MGREAQRRHPGPMESWWQNWAGTQVSTLLVLGFLHGTSPPNFTALPALAGPLGPSPSGHAKASQSPEHPDRGARCLLGRGSRPGPPGTGMALAPPHRQRPVYFHILLSA